MDRLHTVTVVSLLVGSLTIAAGCEKSAKSEAPVKTKSRVNAVVAKEAPPAQHPTDFCDLYSPGDEAAKFTYPSLAGEPPTSPDGWRWVNIWATWCKPCVEEMPRLVGWEKDLQPKGLSDVVFVSADETEDIVTNFRADHPQIPHDIRLETPDTMNEWLAALGLEGAASLPVHVFVDDDDRVRCIRMGGVSDKDLGAVERVIGG